MNGLALRLPSSRWLVLLALVGSACARNNTGRTLNGVAYEFVDSGGELSVRSLAGVSVWVAGQSPGNGLTDQGGRFQLTGVPSGSLSLRASKEGYPLSGTIPIDGSATTANVYLIADALLARLEGTFVQMGVPVPTTPTNVGSVDRSRGVFVARLFRAEDGFPLGGARAGVVGTQLASIARGRGEKPSGGPPGGGVVLDGLTATKTIRLLAPGFTIPDLTMTFEPGVVVATEIAAAAALPVNASPSPITFREAAAELGVLMHHAADSQLPYTHPGVIARDLNGDGFVDLLITNSATDVHHLYLNDGTGHFVDATSTSGLLEPRTGRGACAGDIDNDGLPDVYIVSGINPVKPSQLYRNLGGGRFAPVPGGPPGPGGTGFSCAFADIDGDGNLDLAVAGSTEFTALTKALVVIYRNMGGGNFTEALRITSVGQPWVFGVGFSDYDEDGKPDLFASSFTSPVKIFRNISDSQGINFIETDDRVLGTSPSINDFPAGFTFGDYTGDGHEDFFAANVADLRLPFLGYLPQLSRNFLGRWDPIARRYWREEIDAGVADTAWTWAGDFADLDNDGVLDLYTVGNQYDYAFGHVDGSIRSVTGITDFGTPIEGGIGGRGATLFRGDGDGHFTDVTSGSGIADPLDGRTALAVDVNGDGRLDLVTTNVWDRVMVFLNTTATTNHWLGVRAVGTVSNRDAIGARVVLTARGRKQLRVIHAGGQYASSSDPRVFFGLGSATIADSVQVTFPSGRTATLNSVAVDRIVQIVEP